MTAPVAPILDTSVRPCPSVPSLWSQTAGCVVYDGQSGIDVQKSRLVLGSSTGMVRYWAHATSVGDCYTKEPRCWRASRRKHDLTCEDQQDLPRLDEIDVLMASLTYSSELPSDIGQEAWPKQLPWRPASFWLLSRRSQGPRTASRTWTSRLFQGFPGLFCSGKCQSSSAHR